MEFTTFSYINKRKSLFYEKDSERFPYILFKKRKIEYNYCSFLKHFLASKKQPRDFTKIMLRKKPRNSYSDCKIALLGYISN